MMLLRKLPVVACCDGGVTLKACLSATVWLKTVLIAGRPIWSIMAPVVRSSVVAQTPIVPPLSLSASLGSSSTMPFVLKLAKKSMPAGRPFESVWSQKPVRPLLTPRTTCLNASRSKKNGSARSPAKTRPSPLSAFVAPRCPPPRTTPWASVRALAPA